MRAHLMCATAQCKESCSSPWFELLVLVALLVIGGIEVNPGPNDVSVTYTQVNITSMLIPMVPAACAGGH